MSMKYSFGDVRIGEGTQPSGQPQALGAVAPFRIGVLGNFRGLASDAPRRLWERVDRDNFARVMERFGVALRVRIPSGGETPIALSFREMEDFTPDRLLARNDSLRGLADLRKRLAAPSTFAAAAAEVKLAKAPEPLPAPAPSPAPAPGDLLERIVQQADTAGKSTTPEAWEWSRFLTEITAAHVVHEDPRQPELVAAVEAKLAEVLREILHHPEFRALESLWRSVHLLIRRLETDATLTIDLVDVTRDDLASDLLSKTALDATATYKRLVESTVGTPGAAPWALLIGAFTFEPATADVALLWRLGQIARLAGAPFVAAAASRFVGCASFADTPDPDDWEEPHTPAVWSELRHSEEAPFLGLVLPRMIARAPYAPDQWSVDAFPFVEFPDLPQRDAYLWGNPAFAVALALGRAFSYASWSWKSAFDQEISDLPVILEERDGDTEAVPCAEILIRERALDRVTQHGLIALLSLAHGDSVRLSGLDSIAEPACLLAVPGE